MERVGYKARDFDDAQRYTIEQMRAMTPSERMEVAAILRAQAYGTDNPDLRDAGRKYARKSHLW